jgi:transcriptional regulator with XRE-family HTH domain
MPSVTPEELDALIAGNVRAARARLQLRQQDLADEMGWPRLTVGSIELGRKRVTLADAIALCAALQIDLRQLLAGVDPETLGTLGIERRGESL